MELTLGTHHAHVPILVSDDIRENRDRVLVLLPGDSTDLGIWSHRAIGNSTINEGSMVNVVAAAREQGYSIIIANNGALRYDPELGTTVTHATWYARRKPWKLGGMLRDFDLSWNAVPGNMSAEEHVRFVFENVVKKLVPTKAKISIIAADMGATSIIEYLDKKENCKLECAGWFLYELLANSRVIDNKFKKQLYTMVISESGHHIAYLENPDLKTFLRRVYRLAISSLPVADDFLVFSSLCPK